MEASFLIPYRNVRNQAENERLAYCRSLSKWLQ